MYDAVLDTTATSGHSSWSHYSTTSASDYAATRNVARSGGDAQIRPNLFAFSFMFVWRFFFFLYQWPSIV